jgi:hypothetical protein
MCKGDGRSGNRSSSPAAPSKNFLCSRSTLRRSSLAKPMYSYETAGRGDARLIGRTVSDGVAVGPGINRAHNPP